METINIIIFEYLLGYCLQSFAVVLGIYNFNKQRLVLKDYILASVLVTIISCFVRLLPMSFGIHVIINIMFVYVICVILLKMPAYVSVRSALLVMVIILICEMVVTAITTIFIGVDNFNNLLKDPLQKSYVGVLANILFSIVMSLQYYLFMKKGEKNRSISTNDSE